MVWQWCFNQYKIFGVCVFSAVWYRDVLFSSFESFISLSSPTHSISNRSTDDNEYNFFLQRLEIFTSFFAFEARRFFSLYRYLGTLFSYIFALNEYDWICFHLGITNGFFAYFQQMLIEMYHQKANANRTPKKPASRLSLHWLYILYLFFQWNEMKWNVRRAVSLNSIPIYLWTDDFASCANSVEFLLSSPYEYYIGKRQVHYGQALRQIQHPKLKLKLLWMLFAFRVENCCVAGVNELKKKWMLFCAATWVSVFGLLYTHKQPRHLALGLPLFYVWFFHSISRRRPFISTNETRTRGIFNNSVLHYFLPSHTTIRHSFHHPLRMHSTGLQQFSPSK